MSPGRLTFRKPRFSSVAAMNACAIFALLVLSAQFVRADDCLLTKRPATIVTVDPTKGVARITVSPKPFHHEAQTITTDVWITYARVIFNSSPNHNVKGGIADLRPGMKVQVSGNISISSEFLTEIIVDQH